MGKEFGNVIVHAGDKIKTFKANTICFIGYWNNENNSFGNLKIYPSDKKTKKQIIKFMKDDIKLQEKAFRDLPKNDENKKVADYLNSMNVVEVKFEGDNVNIIKL